MFPGHRGAGLEQEHESALRNSRWTLRQRTRSERPLLLLQLVPFERSRTFRLIDSLLVCSRGVPPSIFVELIGARASLDPPRLRDERVWAKSEPGPSGVRTSPETSTAWCRGNDGCFRLRHCWLRRHLPLSVRGQLSVAVAGAWRKQLSEMGAECWKDRNSARFLLPRIFTRWLLLSFLLFFLLF